MVGRWAVGEVHSLYIAFGPVRRTCFVGLLQGAANRACSMTLEDPLFGLIEQLCWKSTEGDRPSGTRKQIGIMIQDTNLWLELMLRSSERRLFICTYPELLLDSRTLCGLSAQESRRLNT